MLSDRSFARRARALALGLALASGALGAPATYTVQAGDTLSRVARARGVSLDALLAANPALDPARPLQIGQILNVTLADRASRGTRSTVRAASSSNVGWITPLAGVITTRFFGTFSRHQGLDLAAPRGTPVVAARGGVVREARFDRRAGWGNTVLIDHGDGFQSRYSHNSALLVRVGQAIARVGSTGNSTGPHLDFRGYKNGVAVDPLAPQ